MNTSPEFKPGMGHATAQALGHLMQTTTTWLRANTPLVFDNDINIWGEHDGHPVFNGNTPTRGHNFAVRGGTLAALLPDDRETLRIPADGELDVVLIPTYFSRDRKTGLLSLRAAECSMYVADPEGELLNYVMYSLKADGILKGCQLAKGKRTSEAADSLPRPGGSPEARLLNALKGDEMRANLGLDAITVSECASLQAVTDNLNAIKNIQQDSPK